MTPKQRLCDVLPPLVFGTATFNNQYNKNVHDLDTTGLVQQAFAHGIRAFDTSPYYGPAEELLGAAFDTEVVRNTHSRQDYYILSKVGRVAGDEFDYSAPWVRHSVQRSLKRLHTNYLDVVYCHDAEFVSQEEVLEAVKELRRLRDEEGKLRYVGISGYPIEVLCQLSERVLRETGEPLDIVMSYANYTLQNTNLLRAGVPRLMRAGVDVVPNASPLGMGLLRRVGPPIGLTDFHPAGQDLRIAIQRASDFCDGHDEKFEKIAIRWALESWMKEGSMAGARGDPASGVPHRRETIEELGGHKLGVSVMGVSKLEELQETMRIWRSILDGLENGQETANAAGRWRKDHEWSLNRQKAVQLLAEGIQESMGDFLDHTWPSPPPGFVNKRKPPTPLEAPLPTPEASPPPELEPVKALGEPVQIHHARSKEDLEAVVDMFKAYALSLDIDLTFQDFENEINGMPGKYAPPQGELLLARRSDTDAAVGAVGLRALELPNICEMKRLYVSPYGRGLGTGRLLAEAVVEVARKQGYKEMRLDTLPSMKPAQRLYEQAGFVEVDRYYETPLEGTKFMALQF